MRADLVTVFHNDVNRAQAEDLLRTLQSVEPEGGFRFITVDNRVNNRGFARACNLGAFHPEATAPVIGFLNPDTNVGGPFLEAVNSALFDRVVITGCRFGKPERELREWGVRDWVCGAALFVNRKWFFQEKGFDEQFVWSHEETDLIRRAESQGLCCRSIDLPLAHLSPDVDTSVDVAYKHYHFQQAQKRYLRKWGR